MNNELKSCPFCGGDCVVLEIHRGGGAPSVYVVIHTDDSYRHAVEAKCPHVKQFCSTEQEAAEAWNTRAIRTCKQVLTERNDGLMPPFTAHCSECGAQWGYTPNYCPHCEAEVVG